VKPRRATEPGGHRAPDVRPTKLYVELTTECNLHSHVYYFRGEHKSIRCYRVGNVNDRSLLTIWQDEGYRGFRARVRDWEFSPCIDCGGCDLRETNEQDCYGDAFPRCGECLWAAGLVQCP